MSSLIHREDRIFVAGGNGMAGSAVLRRLHNGGYQNLISPSRNELDLRDAYQTRSWFESAKPDVVVLAAAKVGGIHANSTQPADFLLENLKIQNNVIESAWATGTRRLLFLGSSCIYPKFAPQPIREDALLGGPLEPTNEWYAIAKIAGIELCRALRHQYSFDAISLMPTNLYGPGDNYHPTHSHVLPALLRRFHEASQEKKPVVTCWGSGSPLREFLHVDDLADAILFCLERWQPAEDELPYLNVGSGSEVSIRQLATMIAEAVGYTGNIVWDPSQPDGTPRKRLDVERLTCLGWKAQIDLGDGIRGTAAEYVRLRDSGQEVRL